MGYLLGRGPVYIGKRNAAGDILALEEFHAPTFEVDASEAEYAKHFNSNGKVKALDLNVLVQLTAKAKIVIDTNSPKILAASLGGEVTEIPVGGNFADKAFPAGLAVGKTYAIPGGFTNLDTLAITDSAGAPATLVAGVNYKANLAAGTITIINLGAFVQPLKAAGSEADAFSVISIATKATEENFVRFAGINLGDGDKPIIIDLYRASFPTTKVSAKTDGNEVATFDFDVELLADPFAPFDAQFGQYGRVVQG